jgi:hypothetical protein
MDPVWLIKGGAPLETAKIDNGRHQQLLHVTEKDLAFLTCGLPVLD